MDFLDFTLTLGSADGQTYWVRVLDSPAGQARGVFSFPSELPGIDGLWGLCGRSVRSRGAFRDMVALPGQSSHQADRSTERLGETLFQTLLPGAVATRFAESRGHVQGRPGHGLRLKIHFDPSEPELARLCTLPWEFLYLPETRDFLGRCRSWSLVRYLDVARPPQPLPFQPPLRIAVLLSSPRDLPPLALCRERHAIKKAFEAVGGAKVTFLEWSGPAALRHQLIDGGFHVFHFMGHGLFDSGTGEGALMIENSEGRSERLGGRRLSELLKDIGSLRLAVLNACETGMSPAAGDLDPFAGVATSLVLGGLPAVVAMQFRISDAAALAFSRTFYSRLAKGDVLDEAVSEGRLAIYAEAEYSLEWATPVLFMRIPDGKLFNLPRTDKAHEELAMGLDHLLGGELAAAEEYFRKAVALNARHTEAAFYLCLCRLARRPPADLSLRSADELNESLSRLIERGDEPGARLSRILLGILRHDFYRAKRLQAQGILSSTLFRELEGLHPTPEERAALRHVQVSKAAALLLNLD